MKFRYFILVCALALSFRVEAQDEDDLGTPNIGERLFLETRFAEFFFANCGSNANATLTNGDPVMNTSASALYGPLPGPFAGQSMNCRACHMVEEHESFGNRTYCDFAARSPIPNIGDGRTTTPRNAMPLVDALLPRATPLLLHNDGQFASTQDLIIATLTGRNYGWAPTQYATAVHHIAQIIRNDNGNGALAQQYGGWTYPQTFAGIPQIDAQYLILSSFRLYDLTETNQANPYYVSDGEILHGIAALIESYLQTLVFSQDTNNNFNGSPFDVFLIKNGLPQQPAPNESPLQYSRRLLQLVTELSPPQFVTDPADGHFETEANGQLFKFGTNELAGMEIFFADSANLAIATNLQRRGITKGIEVGNCIACHSPPAFTDFLFHNTGAAQNEYDGIYGAGAFMNLAVPGLSERETNYDAYLPPTTNHPFATGIFEMPPTPGNPGQVDLGLWNVFANPDFPTPQPALQQILPLLFAPQISGTGITGTNFFVTGANGPPGGTYYVSVSTNLLSPPDDWVVIATNSFDSEGHFSFTNGFNPGLPQEFYTMSLGVLTQDTALTNTIARFKTPGVRDLVSSEPYLHTGQMNTIEDVLNFYITFSTNARAGTVRNADGQLSGIFLDASAVPPLAAFLRALNEENYANIPCPCAFP